MDPVRYKPYIPGTGERNPSAPSTIPGLADRPVMRNLWMRSLLALILRSIIVHARTQITLARRVKAIELQRDSLADVSALITRMLPERCPAASNLPDGTLVTDRSVQDELIHISECSVLRNILEEVHDSSCFAVVAEEILSEDGLIYISVCLTYVRGADVIERFIGFFELDEYDAVAVSDGVKDLMMGRGFDFKRCVAQFYYGSAVMYRSSESRLNDYIGGECPGIRRHCNRLRLSLLLSCHRIRGVLKLMDLLRSIQTLYSTSDYLARFFRSTEERYGALVGIEEETALTFPRKPWEGWCHDLEGLQYFKVNYKTVIKALEIIFEVGSTDEAEDCEFMLEELRSFDTVVTLVILHAVLNEAHVIPDYLGNSRYCWVEAEPLFRRVLCRLEQMRSVNHFKLIWKDAEAIADDLCIWNPTNVGGRTEREHESTAEGSTGSPEAQSPPGFDFYLEVFYQTVDEVAAELSRWTNETDDMMRIIDTTDPRSRNFLNEERIKSFCLKFSYLKIDSDAISAQATDARDLLLDKGCKDVGECLARWPELGDRFQLGDLHLFFKISLLFSATLRARPKYYEERLSLYLRSAADEDRMSALAVLTLEPDLASALESNPDPVIDYFMKQM